MKSRRVAARTEIGATPPTKIIGRKRVPLALPGRVGHFAVGAFLSSGREIST